MLKDSKKTLTFLFLILFLSIGKSQTINVPEKTDSTGIIDQERVQKALEEMRFEKDEFRNSVTFFSKKTPKVFDDEDRLILLVNRNDTGRLFLNLIISHVVHFASYLMHIEHIIIKADSKTFNINNTRFIFGNGGRNPYFKGSFPYKSPIVKFLEEMLNAEEVKVRFEGSGGKYADFTVSSRERKAVADVLEFYKANTGIN